MPNIRLPDGSVKHFDAPGHRRRGRRVDRPRPRQGGARRQGRRQARRHLVPRSSATPTLAIVTDKDPDGLDVLRHSTAHLLAYAVKELFPDAQVTIGPVIENGFYYDFSYKRPFTPEDLAAIEAKMAELAKKDEPVARRLMPRDDAVAFFEALGEHYKAEIIASIPADEDDLALRRGRLHRPLPRPARAVDRQAQGLQADEARRRLLARRLEERDAAADLRHRLGEEGGPRGLPDPLEEAEKRDHRKLGRALDLFHLQDEAPGMVFWHPKGWAIWQQVEQYMRRVYQDNGYQEVKCPQILDRTLWEKSGHWENYKENMFTTESEKRDYAIKPMNCPGHVQIFNSGLRSYRDLPLRYGEFGACHRNEPSGALHGIMRVRAFTQDDGHIFCTEDQIQPEVTGVQPAGARGLPRLRLHRRRDQAGAAAGQAASAATSTWDRAESALRDALRACGVEWTELPGEGAFYGPKIEYHLKDSIGRSWQCGTMQVDFSMPQRLGAEYVAEDNTRKVPGHAAPGHRRLAGALHRHPDRKPRRRPAPVAGAGPGGRAEHHRPAGGLRRGRWRGALQAAGFRVLADLRNEKITYKIREHSLQKLPYQLIVGDKEMQADTVAVRTRGGEDLGAMPVDALIARLREEVAARR